MGPVRRPGKAGTLPRAHDKDLTLCSASAHSDGGRRWKGCMMGTHLPGVLPAEKNGTHRQVHNRGDPAMGLNRHLFTPSSIPDWTFGAASGKFTASRVIAPKFPLPADLPADKIPGRSIPQSAAWLLGTPLPVPFLAGCSTLWVTVLCQTRFISNLKSIPFLLLISNCYTLFSVFL